MEAIKRKVLVINNGAYSTTDTVKYAQVDGSSSRSGRQGERAINMTF